MSTDRDVTRIVRSWLHEDAHEDADRILNLVLERIDTTPQRRSSWSAWRRPFMNTYLKVGLAAAVVVLAAFIGIQLLGGSNVGTSGPSPSAAPSAPASQAEPSTPADGSLPEGSFAWFEPTVLSGPFTDVPPITVTIPAPGWACPQGGYEACILIEGGGEDSLSVADSRLPESALIATFTTTGIHVYQDPCQWAYNLPDPPATTADEIAAALAAQPSRDASDPVDVTVGGYPGKMVTLHVPADLGYIVTETGWFTDCVRGFYASYTYGDHDASGTLPTRWHQGPGQIDTFWIVDVDGAVVIINAMYRPDTSAERIEEMRAIAESATFE